MLIFLFGRILCMCCMSGLCVLCAPGFRMHSARLRCGMSPCPRWLHHPKPDADCLTLEADAVASPSGSKKKLKRCCGASAPQPGSQSPHGCSTQGVSCENSHCRSASTRYLAHFSFVLCTEGSINIYRWATATEMCICGAHTPPVTTIKQEKAALV